MAKHKSRESEDKHPRHNSESQDATKNRRSESRRARHERKISEDGENYSMHSASTDSTRPTVHTKRVMPSQSSRIQDGNSNNNNSNGNGDNSIDRKGSNTTPHKRVPGGAAAKLMLRGPKKSMSTEDNCSYGGSQDDHDGPIDTSEIFELMNKTKEEFDNGPSKQQQQQHTKENIVEEDDSSHFAPEVTVVGDEEIEVEFQLENFASTEVLADDGVVDHGSEEEGPLPTILDRKAAYHENASAAVSSLLNPNGINENCSFISDGVTGVYSNLGNNDSKAHSVSAFQSPKNGDLVSMDSFTDEYDPLHKSPTTEPLITCETEEKLDKLSQRMLDPSKTLSDLLRAIASPYDVKNLDRTFMVRRKNACGALKVLTAHNRRRKQICWTVGVLPALTSVLQDAGDGKLEQVYPDFRTRLEYEEARRRAIAALTNLVMPVPNRLAVFHTPGLVQALISNVSKEDGECLEGSCAILAYLAKSQENKILMAQIPGMWEAVLRVLRPEMNAKDAYQEEPSKSDYPMTDESDSDESTVSTEGRSMMSGSTHTSSSDETFDDDDDDDDDEDSFDDDVSTDGESTMASEASSDSSMSESSGDDSRSEYRSFKKRNSSASGATHKKRGKPQQLSPESNTKKMHSNYDKDKFITGARKNLFAMMAHLVKEKDNAYRLVRVPDLVAVVVEIGKMHETSLHVMAVQLLAQLTRHRLNTKLMVFKIQMVIQTMVKATHSTSDVARRYACFAIQNFSHDKSCRQELASSEKLITALCKRARHSKDSEERLAAICALKNLTDEPANLIPLSNTPECIATLMQIAHGQEDGVTELMQFRACDALATISHWLRKIATNGQAMDALKHGGTKPPGMFVPSLKVVGWSQYE